MPAAKGDTLVGVPWMVYAPIRENRLIGETNKEALVRVIKSGCRVEGISIPQTGTPEYEALEKRVKKYMEEARGR